MARGSAAGGRHAGARLGAAILLTGLSPLAAATGFFLNQQSVQGLGRADAGNAVAATDASTVYYNPAGLPLLWQNADARGSDTLFALGAQGIFPTANHSNACLLYTSQPFQRGFDREDLRHRRRAGCLHRQQRQRSDRSGCGAEFLRRAPARGRRRLSRPRRHLAVRAFGQLRQCLVRPL